MRCRRWWWLVVVVEQRGSEVSVSAAAGRFISSAFRLLSHLRRARLRAVEDQERAPDSWGSAPIIDAVPVCRSSSSSGGRHVCSVFESASGEKHASVCDRAIEIHFSFFSFSLSPLGRTQGTGCSTLLLFLSGPVRWHRLSRASSCRHSTRFTPRRRAFRLRAPVTTPSIGAAPPSDGSSRSRRAMRRGR